MPPRHRAEMIIKMLSEHPAGLTAKELATAFGWKNTRASLLMGQMFFANVLDRRNSSGPDRRNNEYTYTIRPPTAPKYRPLTIPLRIAGLASEADRLADMEAV